MMKEVTVESSGEGLTGWKALLVIERLYKSADGKALNPFCAAQRSDASTWHCPSEPVDLARSLAKQQSGVVGRSLYILLACCADGHKEVWRNCSLDFCKQIELLIFPKLG